MGHVCIVIQIHLTQKPMSQAGFCTHAIGARIFLKDRKKCTEKGGHNTERRHSNPIIRETAGVSG